MNTVEIPLTRGLVAVIDAADEAIVSQYKWAVLKGRHTNYATAFVLGSQPPRRVLMHRLISGAQDSFDVDHRDGNGLNNTRTNLRTAERWQNIRNQPKRRGVSKYKGVTRKKGRKKRPWQAQLKHMEVNYHLGYFANEVDAARAYDAAALKLDADFSRINFPVGQ